MPIVTVKNKYQVVIPRSVREQARVGIGDLLDANVEKGKIVFTPKMIVDRGIAQSLADLKKGKSFGPFAGHKQFMASLHKESRKLSAKKTKPSMK